MRPVACVACVAGVAGAAAGQVGQSNIHWEVSADGINWASQVDVVPGATVLFRLRVALSGATALGLSGVNMQPTLSNWDSGGDWPYADDLLPFAGTGGNSTTPAGSVPDLDGLNAPLGRIRPFGAVNITSVNQLRGHLDHGGTTLRVAQAWATSAIGPQNQAGNGGIPISQNTGLFAVPPTFVPLDPWPVVLKLGIRTSHEVPDQPRDIIVDSPLEGFSRYGPSESPVRAANWLLGHDPDMGSPIQNYAPVTVFRATIRVIPAPGAIMLAGAAAPALFTIRRRRSR